MKFIMVFVFISMIQFVFSLPDENQQIEMIVDVVKSYERPSVITAFSCWKSRTKLNITRRLGMLKRPITIKFETKHTKTFETRAHNVFIIADLNCPSVGDYLEKANKSKKFNTPYRWLVLGGQITNGDIVPRELNSYKIAFNSEVIIARKRDQSSFELYIVYKLHANSPDEEIEYFGTWTAASRLQKSKDMDLTTALRRKDLRKEPLAVTFNVDDEETGTDLKNCDFRIHNSHHGVTRWGMRQVLILYEYLNATRVNYFTDEWGYLVNGSWNGVIGNMARGEVDLSGTPIFMSKGRIEFASYLTNPIQTSVKFVFREPPLSYQNNLFLLPFSRAVWYSLAGFILLLTLVVYVNVRWEARQFEDVDIADDANILKQNSLSDVALTIVGAISQQGCFIELRGFMSRLLMFITFLVFLFLFTAYSASIVALLQSSSKQIRTLADLLNSRLDLGVEDNSYNRHYFTSTTEPVRKAIYETKVAPRGVKPKFMSLEQGVNQLRKHPFAFNMDVGAGYKLVEKYFYEHEKCNLQEITYVPPQKPWITCRKDSPYAELFKISFYRLREHGMGDRANKIVFSKKPVCAVSGGIFDSVSIIDIYPCLLFLMYGMLLAFGLLLLEIFRYRKQRGKTINLNEIK